MMDMKYRYSLEKSFRVYAAREAAWQQNDRRGRWVVLERGPGRLLRGSPRHLRDLLDAITEIRGRRFSSISRARAFARKVNGVVRHWRRQMPGRGPWRRETNPWRRALQSLPARPCVHASHSAA